MDMTTWILVCLTLFLVLGLLIFRYSAWPVRNVFANMGLESPPASMFFGHFFEGIKHGIFNVQSHFYSMYKDKKVNCV